MGLTERGAAVPLERPGLRPFVPGRNRMLVQRVDQVRTYTKGGRVLKADFEPEYLRHQKSLGKYGGNPLELPDEHNVAVILALGPRVHEVRKSTPLHSIIHVVREIPIDWEFRVGDRVLLSRYAGSDVKALEPYRDPAVSAKGGLLVPLFHDVVATLEGDGELVYEEKPVTDKVRVDEPEEVRDYEAEVNFKDAFLPSTRAEPRRARPRAAQLRRQR